MNFKSFIISTKNDSPPSDITDMELAMWYALNDSWDNAHQTAQSIKNDLGSWIHAYLHRIEGDIGNANYWYRKADRPPYQGPLDDEAEEIIRSITGI